MVPVRPLLLALAASLLLLASAQSAAAKPVQGPLRASIGIADQKFTIFDDARFRGLGVRQARRSIAWDTFRYGWQVADVDAWMNGARAAGVTPLITFARSRIGSRRHVVPTPAQLRTAFVTFRKRYPWAKDFVASNESNHAGEPTGRRPKLAVRYYKTLKKACPSCRIAAATLLDYPNIVSWTRAFLRAAKMQPRYWALHNYVSANRFDLRRTRAFLRAVKGEVWITEVGGAVSRPRAQVKFPEGVRHAAKVTEFIFRRLVRLSPRIRRVYLYHWSSGGPGSSWDSALTTAGGRPRPAYSVLKRVLDGARARRTPPVITGELPQ